MQLGSPAVAGRAGGWSRHWPCGLGGHGAAGLGDPAPLGKPGAGQPARGVQESRWACDGRGRRGRPGRARLLPEGGPWLLGAQPWLLASTAYGLVWRRIPGLGQPVLGLRLTSVWQAHGGLGLTRAGDGAADCHGTLSPGGLVGA